MRSPTVLAISEQYRPIDGGGVTYTTKLSQALAREGCAVHLVISTPLTELPRHRWTSQNGVFLYNIPAPQMLGCNTRLGRRYFTFRLRTRIRRMLRDIQPDVVHVLYGHTVPWIFHFLPVGMSKVWTVQNVPPNEYGSSVLTPFPSVNTVLYAPYLRLVGAVHRRNIRRFPFNHMVSPSERTRDALVHAGVSRERVTVIPNGVDTDVFQPFSKTSVDEIRRGVHLSGDPLVLSVAGVVRHKGQLAVINALSLLRKRYPKVRFVNMGEVRDLLYAAEVQRAIRDEHLEDACTFLPGTLPEELVSRHYNACDVYVQPSSVEGFGIAVLEAISCGRSVVGTTAGTISRMIQDAGAGIVIEPGNTRALAQSIAYLYTHPPSPAARRAMHTYVQQSFSWSTVARSTMALYATLLRNAQA